MSEWKDFYWAHRDVFRLGMAVGVVLIAQSVFIFWAFRRIASCQQNAAEKRHWPNVANASGVT